MADDFYIKATEEQGRRGVGAGGGSGGGARCISWACPFKCQGWFDCTKGSPALLILTIVAHFPHFVQ